jgi:hypothetical protein
MYVEIHRFNIRRPKLEFHPVSHWCWDKLQTQIPESTIDSVSFVTAFSIIGIVSGLDALSKYVFVEDINDADGK